MELVMKNDNTNKSTTEDNVIVRLVKSTELKTIDKINRECLRENYDMDVWEYLYFVGKIYVAVVDNSIVGYLCIASLPDSEVEGKVIEFKNSLDKNSNDITFVVSFAVLEEHRNKKIGNKLLQKLEKYNDSNLVLNVRVSNASAQHLYKKYGFEIFGDPEVKYYSNPTEDSYFMYKKSTIKKN